MATQPHQSSMKILQREAQPANGKIEPEPKTKRADAAAPAAFTALEFAAAEQLLHLRRSSASSGTPRARPVATSVAPSGSSFSSSLRSVNAPPAAPSPGAVILGGCVDWEEEEEDEVAGSQRRVKRYRLITEIYAATEEIGGRSGGSRKNKKE